MADAMRTATPATKPARARRLRRGRAGGRSARLLTPYALLLPVVAMTGIFIYWPLIYSMYLSLLDWNLVSPVKDFAGFDNYRALLDSPEFWTVMRNTGVYVGALVPLLVAVPLALAYLLWPLRNSKAQPVYQAVLFTPAMISFAIAASVWFFIFNPIQGALNQIIVTAGGERVNWLSHPNVAIWCIVAVTAWKLVGFNLLLFLAALRAVPTTYIEAASLDGAKRLQMFRNVQLPLITPTIFFVLVVTVIVVSEDVFAAISILTQGGPFDRTSNLLYFLYERGFQFFQAGEASATAVIIFVLVMSVTWLQFRFIERRVHYGGKG
jgi:multiple sugar transport system permease protein/sn-glycerol 3-phosphate transport system permease protein